MWGLIHYLDTCDVVPTVKALITETSVLAEQAPEWMQILHIRLTNGEATALVYQEDLAHASPEVKETIERILLALWEKSSLPLPLPERLRYERIFHQPQKRTIPVHRIG